MMKNGKVYYFILISFILVSCFQKQRTSSVQIRQLPYPSASAVEYYEEKLYVMGDDATNLLILDTNLNLIDSVPVISYTGRRIPKATKPDLESAALYSHGNSNVILLLGSMSLLPQRAWCWYYDLGTRNIDSTSLQTLPDKIKAASIEQVNVEGACIAYDYLLLANRGNKSYPKSHLIIGPKGLWKSDSSYDINVLEIVTQSDSNAFSSISGLYYADTSNKLIMSVSTEDTRSFYEDGAIGKSYLWIIDNFSIKRENKTISPDRVIDLEQIDERFKGCKIESVTVISETASFYRLVLVADNDNGSSTIFKLSVGKN